MVKLIIILNGNRLPDTTYKTMEELMKDADIPTVLDKFLPQSKEDVEEFKKQDITLKVVAKRVADDQILMEFAGKYHGTKNPFAVVKALPATVKKKGLK